MNIITNDYGTKFINVDELDTLDSDNIQQYNYPNSVHLYTAIKDGSVHAVEVKDWTKVRNGYALTYGNGSQVQIYKTLEQAVERGRTYLASIQELDGNIVPTANWREIK